MAAHALNLHTLASTQGLPDLSPLNHRRMQVLSFEDAMVEMSDIVGADCWAVVFDTHGCPRRVIYNLFEERDSCEAESYARSHLINNPGSVLNQLGDGTVATMYLGEWAYVIVKYESPGTYTFDENSVYVID